MTDPYPGLGQSNDEAHRGFLGLVLSLFPGIGLLDMAFEEEGFCVVPWSGPAVGWRYSIVPSARGEVRRGDRWAAVSGVFSDRQREPKAVG